MGSSTFTSPPLMNLSGLNSPASSPHIASSLFMAHCSGTTMHRAGRTHSPSVVCSEVPCGTPMGTIGRRRSTSQKNDYFL